MLLYQAPEQQPVNCALCVTHLFIGAFNAAIITLLPAMAMAYCLGNCLTNYSTVYRSIYMCTFHIYHHINLFLCKYMIILLLRSGFIIRECGVVVLNSLFSVGNWNLRSLFKDEILFLYEHVKSYSEF